MCHLPAAPRHCGFHPQGNLAVIDAKVGGLIKEKLGVQCIADNSVLELIRGIRSQMEALVPGLATSERLLEVVS